MDQASDLPEPRAVALAPPAEAARAGRVVGLDWLKGLLVVAMLLHHVAGFFAPEAAYGRFLRNYLLQFGSGSYLVISGLIIGTHYVGKYQAAPGLVSSRLVTRGLKLVILFLLINLATGNSSLAHDNHGVPHLADVFWRVFVVGEGRATVEVLLGIGYTMVLATGLLWAGAAGTTLAALAVLTVCLFPLVDWNLSTNGWMVISGMAGYLVGRVLGGSRGEQLAAAVRGSPRAWLWGAGLASLLYYGLSAWLGAGKQSHIALYLFGIFSILGYLFQFCTRRRFHPRIEWVVLLMARYTLFCYVWQLALAWLWYRAVAGLPVLGSYLVSLVVVSAAMLATVVVLDRLRRRSSLVDRAYRLIME